MTRAACRLRSGRSPPALPLRGLRIAAIACLKREKTMLGALAEPDRWNATTLRDPTKKLRRGRLAAVRAPFWTSPCCLLDAARLKAIATGRSLPQTDEGSSDAGTRGKAARPGARRQAREDRADR